jgi:hypothetical protein
VNNTYLTGVLERDGKQLRKSLDKAHNTPAEIAESLRLFANMIEKEKDPFP